MIKTSDISCFYLLIICIFLTGCSAQKSNKILTFFFDGVPGTEQEQQNDSVFVALNDASTLDTMTSIAKPSVYYHYPYLEKECGSCHLESSMGDFVEPQPALCYQCHENFEDTYPYIHGPAAGGYCTSCHNPHWSDKESLLLRKGRDLCVHCHNASSLFNKDIHSAFGDADCMECHNPHGGTDRTLLY